MFSFRLKACDAIGDDEPPEFSDDEEEQAYYENLKQKGTKDSNGQNSQKRQRRMGKYINYKISISCYKQLIIFTD